MSIKHVAPRAALLAIVALAAFQFALRALADEQLLQTESTPPAIHKVQAADERVEMTVRSSRILSSEEKIPRAAVNDKDILDLTPLSAKEVRIYAKKTGVTQVYLWDEKGQIHAIDVIVMGDARELSLMLKSQFPSSAITVFPTASGVILKGYVDNPDNVQRIVDVTKQYFPNVIDNMRVGGGQQVLLHVRVMEVSRTKLRDLGFDFSEVTSSGSFVSSSVSGLLNATASSALVPTATDNTFKFGIVDGGNTFFGLLSAMQRNQIAKVLAEPNITTVNGRAASFQAGGKIPYPMPASLGQPPSIQFQQYGTQIDFVPIILGHGTIRLEVRPSVSELDFANSLTIAGTVVPALRTRYVDTAVELKVGQTLAIAGLIQTRIDSTKKGLPWLSDLPYLGVPFRRNQETQNEVELLVLVRPELAEAMDCNEVPPGGPGTFTTSPNDCQLYLKGYMEVPVGPQVHGARPAGPIYPAGPAVEELPPGRALPGDRRLPPTTEPPAATSPGHRGPTPPFTLSSEVRKQSNPAAEGAGPTPAAPPSSRRENSYNRSAVQGRQSEPTTSADSEGPGFIGPRGIDVKN